MKTRNKISLTLLAVMSIMFLILIANMMFNFRDYGIQGIDNKAKAVAQTVEHSLTSHMINGVMNNRKLFLSQIEELENIDKVWLVRGPKVIKQYGAGLNSEIARDDIDRSVVETGIIQKKIEDNLFGSSSYRITIPYKAVKDGKINCLDCHDAKIGDTLGAISLQMSIDDLKNVGMITVFHTAVIAFVLIIFILFFVNRLIAPYLTVFDSIKHVMRKAQEGNYSFRIEDTKGKESKEVAIWVNGLLEKLQNTLDDIENKIHVFLTNTKKDETDPLIDVKSTVNQLSEIYKFKKTIEHDEKINEVYARFADVLKDKFKLTDFNFLEADTTGKTVKTVYAEKEIHCDAEDKGCRADRTNTLVDSCQFKNLCDRFYNKDDMEYICVPYSISNDLDFILSIVTKNKEESKKVRKLLPHIQDYVDTAKPEIVSKKLMEILEKSARTDALTGLYNRKFLEESIDTIVFQAKRISLSYGILMADIDFFKMINDTYGHDVGDEAIKIIANTLVENIRSSDIVVRYGGEEFIVLLYNCDAEYIKDIAEKIRASFATKKIKAGNESFTKTISIGASMYPKDSNSFWQCIKYADVALYNAKSTGRDKVVLFDKDLLKEGELENEY